MAGTMVSDALAIELNDGGATTSSEAGSEGWVECDWPLDVAQAEVAVGTCSGTGVSGYIQIQGADVADGTGKVVLGVVGPITQDSDDVTYRVPIYAEKKYIRAYIYVAGTTPSITPTVTLREKHYQRTRTTTGGVAT